MSNRHSPVKVVLLLLYAVLFALCEWLSLRYAHKDPAFMTTAMVPLLYVLLIATTAVAVVLSVIERGKVLVWGMITHGQYLICLVPLLLHFIVLLREMEQKTSTTMLSFGPVFTIRFEAGLLAYCLIPLNAICVLGYYFWAASQNPPQPKAAA